MFVGTDTPPRSNLVIKDRFTRNNSRYSVYKTKKSTYVVKKKI